MGTHYLIAGKKFHRKNTIKLSSQERNSLNSGTVLILKKVEWPLIDSTPLMEHAYVDPGCTEIWGKGSYLKIPNVPHDTDKTLVNRIFCPWGYPPDKLRVAWHKTYVEIEKVTLVQSYAVWYWQLTLSSL